MRDIKNRYLGQALASAGSLVLLVGVIGAGKKW
jgi:hypothetical protein